MPLVRWLVPSIGDYPQVARRRLLLTGNRPTHGERVLAANLEDIEMSDDGEPAETLPRRSVGLSMARLLEDLARATPIDFADLERRLSAVDG